MPDFWPFPVEVSAMYRVLSMVNIKGAIMGEIKTDTTDFLEIWNVMRGHIKCIEWTCCDLNCYSLDVTTHIDHETGTHAKMKVFLVW